LLPAAVGIDTGAMVCWMRLEHPLFIQVSVLLMMWLCVFVIAFAVHVHEF
jgi:hypothetical protein